MFPESIKYAAGHIVASYALLASVKLVLDPNVPRVCGLSAFGHRPLVEVRRGEHCGYLRALTGFFEAV